MSREWQMATTGRLRRREDMAGHGNPPVEVTDRDADIIWRFDPIDEVGVCRTTRLVVQF